MKNPFPLCSPIGTQTSSIPLIMFHDSGGTIIQYHGLQDLDRPIWGIHNPFFYSGRQWKGGIPEMATVYIEMIKSINAGPDIIVGGWSFGGLIALEIAHQLTSLKTLNVAGIIMLDSLCPLATRQKLGKVCHTIPRLGDHVKPELQMLVLRSMKAASIMADNWVLPRWERSHFSAVLSEDSSASTPRSEYHYTYSDPSDSSLVRGDQVLGESGVMALDTLLDTLSRAPSPPVVLIRCEDLVPGDCKQAIAKVDSVRSSPSLGWENYSSELITSILTVPGHHFEMFSKDKAIKDACKIIEQEHTARIYYS